jgi:hypothetical protein
MFDFLKASLWGIQFGLVLNADPAEYGYSLLNLHTPVTNCVTVFKFHFDKYNFGNIKQEFNKYEMPKLHHLGAIQYNENYQGVCKLHCICLNKFSF